MAEYIEYHPLKFWLDPASIAEIVAHIQTYLVNNPINSTSEIETIIHDYLIAHPELIGGVDSVNGLTGEVVLTADNISGGENVTIADVLDSLQDQINDIVISIPSDYQQLIDDVSDLKGDIVKKSNLTDVPYIDQNTVSDVEKTGTVFIINESEPRCFSNETDTQGIVHSINRFNIDYASFSMSGYSSHYTITKQNNGIKITSDLTSTSAHYAYTEYTAEFEGTLYLSCDAKLIDGKINTVVMMLLVNGVEVGKAYGDGRLYLATDVMPNDIVRLCFYGHLNEDVGSTVAYENIMLSYGGLYPFVKYKSDTPIGTGVNIYSEKALADYISGATYYSTPKLALVTAFMTDAVGLPPNNNTTASDVIIICDVAIPITDYNTLYADNTLTGIAVLQSGSLAIRVDGLTKPGLINWLALHPLTVKYKTGETTEGDISPDVFQQGITLEYAEQQTIKYKFTKKVNNGSIVCFGDSITGMFTGKTAYTDMLDMLGYEAINCGFSGTGYCDHNNANYLPFSANRLIQAIVEGDYTLQDASPLVDPNATAYNSLYAEHLQNLKNTDFNDIDFVSLFYGTNDWGNDAILLSADDPSQENKQRTNVEDAVKYCISQLVTKYPHLKVLVITPYWRSIKSGKNSNVDSNNDGKYLYEYANKIEEFAQKNYNIPVINLYYNFGANPITNRYFTKDGTHPTERGKLIIAKRIIKCIEEY